MTARSGLRRTKKEKKIQHEKKRRKSTQWDKEVSDQFHNGHRLRKETVEQKRNVSDFANKQKEREARKKRNFLSLRHCQFALFFSSSSLFDLFLLDFNITEKVHQFGSVVDFSFSLPTWNLLCSFRPRFSSFSLLSFCIFTYSGSAQSTNSNRKKLESRTVKFPFTVTRAPTAVHWAPETMHCSAAANMPPCATVTLFSRERETERERIFEFKNDESSEND